MEHAMATTLLVFSLLQLCRAEISQILPGTWYSANAINEDFLPKPISELFSSTPSPSTQSPPTIVTQPPSVVVTYTSPQYSTTQPPSQFTVTQPHTISVTHPHPGFSVTQPIVVLSPSTNSQPPSIAQSPQTTLTETFSTSNIPTFSSTPLPTFGQEGLSTLNFTPSTHTPSLYDIGSTFTHPTVRIMPPTSTQLSTFASEFTTTQSTSSPNFLVIFNAPHHTPPSSVAPQTTISSTPRITSTFGSTSPTTITPSVISTTASSPYTSPTSGCYTSPFIQSTILTSTLAPSVSTQKSLSTKASGLIIRVVAPKGSITNVKINPSSTTRAPRKRKTQRPRKNSYDGCMQSCRARKDILCSIPLSSTMIDPSELKSFPSICHMACHNSYRTPAYEKITDGRCSRLRTRIVSVGGATKIRRDELKKSEYSIVNAGQLGHIVEFSNGSI